MLPSNFLGKISFEGARPEKGLKNWLLLKDFLIKGKKNIVVLVVPKVLWDAVNLISGEKKSSWYPQLKVWKSKSKSFRYGSPESLLSKGQKTVVGGFHLPPPYPLENRFWKSTQLFDNGGVHTVTWVFKWTFLARSLKMKTIWEQMLSVK